MNRKHALERAAAYFDSGAFTATLARRVAYATESQNRAASEAIHAYLSVEIAASLQALGFAAPEIWANPEHGQPPFLYAHRQEPGATRTVLMYAHGDVVRGTPAVWSEGLSPWQLSERAGRLYGRGTADNKGQHSINLGALEAVINARGGRLGFNLKVLMEMGEEVGSPGLEALVQARGDALCADLFIASDGPRLAANRPTLALGSRGYLNFTLAVAARAKPYHSGNWGGLLANPAVILVNALASIVDRHGAIQVAALKPTRIPPGVGDALNALALHTPAETPAVNPQWGEPGLSGPEKLYGWNTFEVLALDCADPKAPGNAIPGRAAAHCHMRLVPGFDLSRVVPALREYLDTHGFEGVSIEQKDGSSASRLSPGDPWVSFVQRSIERSLGAKADLLPNIGGSIPNAPFAQVLGLPTLWLPHSYAGCGQHGPDEHLLTAVAREGLVLMAGLWWDLGAS